MLNNKLTISHNKLIDELIVIPCGRFDLNIYFSKIYILFVYLTNIINDNAIDFYENTL